MALTSIPNAMTSWPGNHSIPSSHSQTVSKQSNFNSLTDGKWISSRTAAFIDCMSREFFSRLHAPEINSLKKLLGFVSKNGVDPIRDALVKKEGYFTRLFSKESWNNWLENKTPIGRVVSLYCDCVTSNTRISSLMGNDWTKVF